MNPSDNSGGALGNLDEQVKKANLAPNITDYVAAFARAVVSACPVLGGLLAEIVGVSIPRQRVDRVVDVLRLMVGNFQRWATNLETVKKHLRDEYGIDILEEGIQQAVQAVSEKRRRRLANLLAASFSQEDLKYAESKKMLVLLRDLTDQELLMLVYYATPPVIGSDDYHFQLLEMHPDVLQPPDLSLGTSQDEIDLGALQDSYKNTLIRLGLLQAENRMPEITPLGELLLRYVDIPMENPTEDNKDI